MEQPQHDYRLNAGDLKANNLPLELEAYPYYPEGIHIPVKEVGNIIITSTAELEVPAVEVGVYDYEMTSNEAISIDIPLEELEDTIIILLATIKQDQNWILGASAQVQEWFELGRG